ncbi:MAG: peptidase renal dipeptidase [Streptosporangiaceae bacterium]|jgi:membrane dipeptidase|nr:peptidase renal dipeptidase [Streptosporangiaceae bacterium]
MTTDEPVTLDAAVPLVQHPRHLAKAEAGLRHGGVHAILATVSSIEDLSTVLSTLGAWQAWARDPRPGYRLARTVSEIRRAREAGEIAIVLHAQGLHAVDADPGLIESYAALGLRIAQLTYNYRNRLADGCLEPADAGLSEAGRAVVRRLNQLRIVPDISHTGPTSSMDIIEMSERPVIASHSNAWSVADSPRNLTDEVIRAVAATGGVIGLCAFPSFVSAEQPTVHDVARHAVHIAELVGAEHIGMGLDYADEDEDDYEFFAYDERYYPRPPWIWPNGIASHADVPVLRAALLAAGFTALEVDGIAGENFLRVFARSWGS